jgi:20S proteasome alpha/beta subunit
MRDHSLFIFEEAPSHSIFPYRRYPYVTGTSVLGITYKDGVLIACDTLGKLILLLFLIIHFPVSVIVF